MNGNFYTLTGSDIDNVTNAIKRATSVTSGCREVEKFLSNFRELTLEFFKDVFPLLLKIILGFEKPQVGVLSSTSAAGWFNIASSPGHNADAKALVALLSPNSILFKALIDIDKTGARFIFPYDRLPDFVCKLLRTEEGRKVLCQKVPLYKNRIENHPAGNVKIQVQVNLFEYYMFWFAFYPTSEGVTSSATRRKTTSSDISSLQMRAPLYSHLGHWKVALPGLHASGTSTSIDPYQELLVLYLSHFLFPLAPSPSPLSNGSLPSLLSNTSRGGVSQAPIYGNIQSPGEKAYGHILLNALLDFWFIGNDPLPVPLTKNERQALMQNLFPSSTFCLPKDELVESQITFVCSICVNLELTSLDLSSPTNVQTSSSLLKRSDSLSPVHVSPFLGPLGVSSPPVRQGFAWQSPISPGVTSPPSRGRTPSLSSYPYSPTIMLQRPLYRFLFRAFTSPASESIAGQISRIVDVWVAFLEPWKSVPEKTHPKRKVSDRTGKTGGTGYGGLEEDDALLSEKGGDHSGKYEDKWESYVLINYPFYSALVLHFLDLAVLLLELDPETVLSAVHKILNVFQSSHQLVELLKNMELVEVHSLQEGLYHHHRGWMRRFYDWLPKIREEVKEWEGLESVTELPAGTMVPRQLTESLFRLFHKDASGGGLRLQKILRQADLELGSVDLLWKVQEGAQMIFEIQPVISGLPPPPTTNQGASRRTGQGSGSSQEGTREEKKWISSISKRLSPVFEMLGMKTKQETPMRTRGGTVVGNETHANSREMEKKGDVYPLQLGKHTWEDAKYKGDYMRRPIESKEIAILVRILVRLSDFLNQALGLDGRLEEETTIVGTERVDERGSEREGEFGRGEDVPGLRQRGRSQEEVDGSERGSDEEDTGVDERNEGSEGLLSRTVFLDRIREREWGILSRELLVTLKVTASQILWFLVAFLGTQSRLGMIRVRKFARKQGWRFNLRLFAEVPVVVFSTVLIFIIYWVSVLFW